MEAALWGGIINSVTTLGVGILVSVFGARKIEKLKSELGVNAQHKLEFMKRKREIYENMCTGIQFVLTDRLIQDEIREYRKLAFETYDKLSLWASNEVCIAADDLFNSIASKKPEGEIKDKYKNLLTSMRIDLNLDPNSEFERDYQFIS